MGHSDILPDRHVKKCRHPPKNTGSLGRTRGKSFLPPHTRHDRCPSCGPSPAEDAGGEDTRSNRIVLVQSAEEEGPLSHSLPAQGRFEARRYTPQRDDVIRQRRLEEEGAEPSKTSARQQQHKDGSFRRDALRRNRRRPSPTSRPPVRLLRHGKTRRRRRRSSIVAFHENATTSAFPNKRQDVHRTPFVRSSSHRARAFIKPHFGLVWVQGQFEPHHNKRQRDAMAKGVTREQGRGRSGSGSGSQDGTALAGRSLEGVVEMGQRGRWSDAGARGRGTEDSGAGSRRWHRTGRLELETIAPSLMDELPLHRGPGFYLTVWLCPSSGSALTVRPRPSSLERTTQKMSHPRLWRKLLLPPPPG
ncbi:hypothetical protein WMY93_006015 [Mugilogobius chulae]|uniref:Uncharacterized protein n=1 Tax=Mugilogobius chulae TaxID=88201 RepID=A0AAW0PJF1_9GOBI